VTDEDVKPRHKTAIRLTQVIINLAFWCKKIVKIINEPLNYKLIK